MIVLGIHGGVTLGQHEPSAALMINGRMVAACEEERYLRIKSAYGYLPNYSIKACLDIAGITMDEVDLVVAPGITYDDFEMRLRSHLLHNFGHAPKIMRIHHQHSHLYAAFYGSGMDDALLVSLDASGDGMCSMFGYGSRRDGIEVLGEVPTANSLGYFYTLMTYYLGFSDGDEYKVMGLAPYGKPTHDLTEILQPAEEGVWQFDWSFVRNDPPPRSPFEPLYAQKIADVLKAPPRVPSQEMLQFYKDVARSTQDLTEEALLGYLRHVKAKRPEARNLCYAGGVALNCKANMKIRKSGMFDNIYVPPVASDRGLAIGCAYAGAVELGDDPWPLNDAYLGSSYSDEAIRKELESNGVPYREVDDPAEAAAELIADGKIIGWHQGRAEIGARALGNRSILASCSDPDMKDKVNARIKYREEFRPFAPSAAQDAAHEYFDTDGEDMPYMCITVDVHENKQDNIPAVVHADGTARLQTVRSSQNEAYYRLIKRYGDMTGTPVIMNTSFNLKGQPIVETPRDALMTFFGCGLDNLVVGNCVVSKSYA